MIDLLVFIVLPIALLLASIACFRIADWQRKESLYWYRVAAQVTLHPSWEPFYRGLLEAARADKRRRPLRLNRLSEWKSPEERYPSHDQRI